MVVLIEMISNWVTRSVVVNGCPMVVYRNLIFVLVSPIQLASPLQHSLHVIMYPTLDELHESDHGLTIDVTPGNVKEGLVYCIFCIFLYDI